MKRRPYLLLLLFISITFFSSCIPQKKLEYLQDPIYESTLYNLTNTPVQKIKPNDELYIKVSSFDDLSYNFFDTQSDYSRTAFNNELALSLISYTVSDSGTIYFPILGTLKVSGLSLDELRIKMEAQLSDYFNQPTVVIKYAYKKITIIGEVNAPGYYTYTKDNINIFEALSMAGDISVHGNISKIYIIRQVNDSIQKNPVDLTSDEIVFSNYYYLLSNDIIYVKPRGSLKWNIISVPISLIFSTISTTILIINYVQGN